MTACANSRCDGHGWVTVLPSYVDTQLRFPTDLLDKVPAELHAEVAAAYPDPAHRASLSARLRAAVADDVAAAVLQVVVLRECHTEAVYPCKDCRTDQFFRWVEGHWDRRHDRAACDSCSTRGRRTPTTDHHNAPAPPERRDLA